MTSDPQGKRIISPKKETLITFAILLAGLVAAFLVSVFVLRLGIVNGPSMEDTLFDGDVIVIWKPYGDLENGDVVVCALPVLKHGTVVKRIVARPGDDVRITNSGELFVNSKHIMTFSEGTYESTELVMPEGRYFLVGDNEGSSTDSRDSSFGYVYKDDIEGKVVFKLFPKMKKI